VNRIERDVGVASFNLLDVARREICSLGELRLREPSGLAQLGDSKAELHERSAKRRHGRSNDAARWR
jgi:hypothetical protein